MKILWHSNAPTNGSGYGTQTALFAPRLAELGHEVAISCMTGLSGQPSKWHGLDLLPCGYAPYGNDLLPEHAKHFFGTGPGLILALYDAWAIDPAAIAGRATAVWAPVHCRPMTGGDRMFFQTTGAVPIAMSRFGEQQMRADGLQPAYVPHGIDTARFQPLSPADRAEARKILGLGQDQFVVTMVAANKGTNPPRKAWGEAFAAFARFRKIARDSVLFVHSLITGAGFGMDLRPLIADLGLTDCIRFSDQYAQTAGLYTPDFVAHLLGCSDVLLNPSMGEGFGLPAMEAQACGIPVIVGRNSAQTEYLGSGWAVDCQEYWRCEDEAWWAVPSIPGIVSALHYAYQRRGNAALAAKAREFALDFDADLVTTLYWKPVLEMLEQYAGAAPVRAGGAVPLPTMEADGLRWILRGRHTGDGLVLFHEDALAPHFDRLLPEGGVFLDVGAHVGRWSLRLARKASRVISVEANPATAAVLRANAALNEVTNVTVLNVAAWDTSTDLVLHDPNQQVTGGSTRVLEPDTDAGYPGSPGLAEARPLDELLAGEDRIDLVKLDVEGADLHALRGMRETLARHRPVMVVERHDIYGYYQLADLLALLAELGYDAEELIIRVQGGGDAPYLVCTPKPPADTEGTQP